MAENKVREAILKNAQKAAGSTRGIYRVTAATNVYKRDGTPLEKTGGSPLPDEPVPTPTEEVDLDDDPEVVAQAIEQAEDGAVIAIPAGEVTAPLSLANDVTLTGVNAGVAQNYKQEVA